MESWGSGLVAEAPGMASRASVPAAGSWLSAGRVPGWLNWVSAVTEAACSGTTFITEKAVSPKLTGMSRRSRTTAHRAYCSRGLMRPRRAYRSKITAAIKTEELMIHVIIAISLQFL